MGDSIGEGVQSLDANWLTQPHGYLNLVAAQMGVPFPLPLILGSTTSAVGSVSGRARISPLQPALDLAVSGATLDTLLNQPAGQPVDDEADLVLEPRSGAQMQIAQSLRAPFTICYIGVNDLYGAVLAWNQLDASQMTPVATFASEYGQIASVLASWHGKVVVGTIFNPAQMAFLFNREDLIRFLGSDFGLPEGSYTAFPTVLLLKMGLANASLLENPGYVLDPTEYAAIQQRLAAFNQIIKADAANAGLAVADLDGMFQQLAQNPPVFHNVPLTTHANGGLWSLDAIHPSDIGYAFEANAFIQAANQAFQANIPQLTPNQLAQIADADPFIDWNGNKVVRGRRFAGLLETLGPVWGISGDLNDVPGATVRAPASRIDFSAGRAFMQRYFVSQGLPANTGWSLEDAIQAMQRAFPPPRPSVHR